jgi:glutaredoxin
MSGGRAGALRPGAAFMVLAALVVAYYAGVALHKSGFTEENMSARLAPGNEVVMYSLTTCPYCKALRARLTGAGIAFKEHFIDTDPPRMREFNELLAAHNHLAGSVGVPTLVVNGRLLVNNPGMEEIKRNLRYKD